MLGSARAVAIADMRVLTNFINGKQKDESIIEEPSGFTGWKLTLSCLHLFHQQEGNLRIRSGKTPTLWRINIMRN